MGCPQSLPEKPIPVQSHQRLERNQTRKQPNRREMVITKDQSDLKAYFEVLKVLGSTQNGILLSARDINSGTIRTISEVSKSKDLDPKTLLKEVSILNTLDNPNILKCFQTLESSRSFYIVLENTEGGPIQNKIKTSCNEVLVAKYMRDVFRALSYMHNTGIIHCNLHVGNLLLSDESENASVKIAGFSNSQKIEEKSALDVLNLSYEFISPDILEGDFDEKTDIWSAGIVVYLLLVQKLPFAAKKRKEILEAISKAELDFENPTFLALSHNAQDFIQKLLSKDKNERLSAREALNHPYLQESSEQVALTYELVQKMRRFKIKTNIVRAILTYMNFKLNFGDHDIITLFKKMDTDFNGNISKDEMIVSFKTIGVDADNEIDSIMDNLDMDGSGSLDFSELKIVLIDWESQIKKKVLGKVFASDMGSLDFENFKQELSEILPSEWVDFCKKVKIEHGKILLGKLKEYIKLNLAY